MNSLAISATQHNSLQSFYNQSGAIDRLISAYQSELHEIESAFAIWEQHQSTLTTHVFAIAASTQSIEDAQNSVLRSHWTKLINTLNIKRFLPSVEWDKLTKSISSLNVPQFDVPSIEAWLAMLIPSMDDLFAQRVDAIFKSLSGTHVTNSPTGFRQKMILQLDKPCTDLGVLWSGSKGAQVHDLRNVVDMMNGGRGELDDRETKTILKICYAAHGSWISIDGGALQVKCFKKGNIHIKVNDVIATKLNLTLANLYPQALADCRRNSSMKTAQSYAPIPVNKQLSQLSRRLLSCVMEESPVGTSVSIPTNPQWLRGIYFATSEYCQFRSAVAELRAVLSCFCISIDDTATYKATFEFDFDVTDVLHHLIVDGRYPDIASHQFYPSGTNCVALMQKHVPQDLTRTYGEPSCGTGALLSVIPKNANYFAVEISPHLANIARSKGFRVEQDDFLHYVSQHEGQIDICVSNPPWHKNLASVHLLASLRWLRQGGEYYGIVPTSTFGSSLEKFAELHQLQDAQVLESIVDDFGDAKNVRCVLVKLVK